MASHIVPTALNDLDPDLNKIRKKAVGRESSKITGEFSEFSEIRALD